MAQNEKPTPFNSFRIIRRRINWLIRKKFVKKKISKRNENHF